MESTDEISRKERLLDLFLKLEESEQLEMKGLIKSKSIFRYERMFKGIAVVTNIGANTIRLERENGKKIKAFEVTSEIAELIKKGDALMMISGLRQGVWRLIRLDCMGSEISIDGKSSMHLSIMGRSIEPSMAN